MVDLTELTHKFQKKSGKVNPFYHAARGDSRKARLLFIHRGILIIISLCFASAALFNFSSSSKECFISAPWNNLNLDVNPSSTGAPKVQVSIQSVLSTAFQKSWKDMFHPNSVMCVNEYLPPDNNRTKIVGYSATIEIMKDNEVQSSAGITYLNLYTKQSTGGAYIGIPKHSGPYDVHTCLPAKFWNYTSDSETIILHSKDDIAKLPEIDTCGLQGRLRIDGYGSAANSGTSLYPGVILLVLEYGILRAIKQGYPEWLILGVDPHRPNKLPYSVRIGRFFFYTVWITMMTSFVEATDVESPQIRIMLSNFTWIIVAAAGLAFAIGIFSFLCVWMCIGMCEGKSPNNLGTKFILLCFWCAILLSSFGAFMNYMSIVGHHYLSAGFPLFYAPLSSWTTQWISVLLGRITVLMLGLLDLFVFLCSFGNFVVKDVNTKLLGAEDFSNWEVPVSSLS